MKNYEHNLVIRDTIDRAVYCIIASLYRDLKNGDLTRTQYEELLYDMQDHAAAATDACSDGYKDAVKRAVSNRMSSYVL